MLKLNDKKAMKKMIIHVLDCVKYNGNETDDEALEILKRDTSKLVDWHGLSFYDAGQQLAKDGFGYVDNDQVYEFLKDLLEETDEEASKYDLQDSWRLYLHLWGKAVQKLLTP